MTHGLGVDAAAAGCRVVAGAADSGTRTRRSNGGRSTGSGRTGGCRDRWSRRSCQVRRAALRVGVPVARGLASALRRRDGEAIERAWAFEYVKAMGRLAPVWLRVRRREAAARSAAGGEGSALREQVPREVARGRGARGERNGAQCRSVAADVHQPETHAKWAAR